MSRASQIILHHFALPALLVTAAVFGFYGFQKVAAAAQQRLSLYNQSQAALAFTREHTADGDRARRVIADYEQASKSSVADIVTALKNSAEHGEIVILASNPYHRGAQFQLEGFSAALLMFVHQLEQQQPYHAVTALALEPADTGKRRTHNPVKLTLTVQPLTVENQPN